MAIPDFCVKCIYDKQKSQADDPVFLAEVRALLEAGKEQDTAPHMVYLCGEAYARHFGAPFSYAEIKRENNDLVLRMEDAMRASIQGAPDPVEKALLFARAGNYIDFASMDHVDPDAFLAQFQGAAFSHRDRAAYRAFLNACAEGNSFLLIADNCGEIVLDRLLIEQLKARFPHLQFTVLVRGQEVLNDVTEADARYAGIDRVAQIVSNGTAIAGTEYRYLPPSARYVLDHSDVILSKGQGNYESLSGQGRHIFYALLCKCDLFVQQFGVPRFTGIFLEENGEKG